MITMSKPKSNKKRGETQYNEEICLFVDIETTTREYEEEEKKYLDEVVNQWLKENPSLNEKQVRQKYKLLLKNGFQEVYLVNLLIGNVKTGEIIYSHFWGGLPTQEIEFDFPVEYHHSTNPILSFIEFLKNKSYDKEYICYCHNLGYEFTFINREICGNGLTSKNKIDDYGFLKEKCVFIEKNKPIQIVFTELPKITFKDSLALFSKSIQKLGKEIKLPKLPYNYEIYREVGKPLEKLDYQYNQRDNEIVFYSIYNQFFKNKNEFTLSKIPLTFTGLTRYNLNKQYKSVKEYRVNVNDKYFSIRNYEFYRFIRKAYTGGLATTNPVLLGQFKEKVLSVDYTSSYPDSMLRNYFPMFIDEEEVEKSYQEMLSRYEKGELKTKPKRPYAPSHYAIHLVGEDANQYFQTHLKGYYHHQLRMIIDKNEPNGKSRNTDFIKGYFARVHLKGLKIKHNDLLLLISKHKVDSTDKDINEILKNINALNGKIFSSSPDSEVILNVSNVQLDNILLLYHVNEIYVSELYLARHEKLLSKQQCDFILKLLIIKDKMKKELKQIENEKGKECDEYRILDLEYRLIKQDINAIYGIKVEDEVKDSYHLLNGEVQKITLNSSDVNSEDVFRNKINRENEEMCQNNEMTLKRHLHIYSQGIYITDFARKHLITSMIDFYENGFITYACDTDSLKVVPKDGYFKNDDEMIKTFEMIVKNHNDDIKNQWLENHRVQNFISDNNISDKECKSIYQLGQMDIESVEDGKTKPYSLFVSLGAKKYAYIDKGGIHITVAGCSKKVGDYLTQYAKENDIPYDIVLKFFFKSGTLVSKNLSGRTIAHYEELPRDLIKQLNPYKQSGGIVIEKTSYFLNITEDDEQFLLMTIEQEEVIKKEQIKRVFEGTLNEDGTVNNLEFITYEEYCKRYNIY